MEVALFTEAGITAGLVADARDLDGHPYISSRDLVVEFDDPDMGRMPMHNVAPRLSETPGEIRHIGPRLGEHSSAILVELGYKTADISKLAENGIIQIDPPGTG